MKVLDTVKLSDTQKRVLAKVIAAPTPRLAAEELSGDVNLVAARDMLLDLGLLQIVQGHASLTDKGRHVAREENIADESGGLTADGEEFAYSDSQGNAKTDQPEQPPATSDVTGGLQLNMSHTYDMYNMQLLRELLTK